MDVATTSYGPLGGCGEEVADTEAGAQMLRTALQRNGFKHLLDIRGLPSQLSRLHRDPIRGFPSAESPHGSTVACRYAYTRIYATERR